MPIGENQIAFYNPAVSANRILKHSSQDRSFNQRERGKKQTYTKLEMASGK